MHSFVALADWWRGRCSTDSNGFTVVFGLGHELGSWCFADKTLPVAWHPDALSVML
jgi:hypothetical protein